MKMGRRCVLADIHYTGDGYDNRARERFEKVIWLRAKPDVDYFWTIQTDDGKRMAAR